MGQTILPPVPGVSYKREVFLSSSTFTLPMTAFNKFDCILVAGGGGGARGAGSASQKVGGGCGAVLYLQEVYCTNGTTLTITVGAGGAGATSAANDGSQGTASTISGIAGSGVSTSVTSGEGRRGRLFSNTLAADFSSSLTSVWSNYGNYSNSNMSSIGWTFGGFGMSIGSERNNLNGNSIFKNSVWKAFSGSTQTDISGTNGGAPIPLLGNLLHATAGASGTAGTSAGGTSYANTFFAGAGGGSYYGTASTSNGRGGGGGAGGRSTATGTTSGVGGNASANSGGGGGGGGRNSSASFTNTGNGGNGGSGFVIIGYWG